MNADGTERRLTNGDASGWDKGSFSRDGTKVVYDGYDANAVSGTSGLYTVDVRGGTRRLIAASSFGSSAGDSGLADPAWSPDGSRIAYADYKSQPLQRFGADEIWTMNFDGTGQRRLVNVGQCGAYQNAGCTDGLAWSPDGSQLAFHSAGGIYLVRGDGSGLHRISTSGGQPIWSPDGSRIAFTRGGELFTMAPDGSDVTLLEGVVVVPNYAWTWNPAG
jgi:Tol biopolymer transport system component